jgi:hypothetical protein
MASSEAARLARAFEDVVASLQRFAQEYRTAQAESKAATKSSDEQRLKVEALITKVEVLHSKIEPVLAAIKVDPDGHLTLSVQAEAAPPHFLATPRGLGMILGVATTVSGIVGTIAAVIMTLWGKPTPLPTLPPPAIEAPYESSSASGSTDAHDAPTP